MSLRTIDYSWVGSIIFRLCILSEGLRVGLAKTDTTTSKNKTKKTESKETKSGNLKVRWFLYIHKIMKIFFFKIVSDVMSITVTFFFRLPCDRTNM